MKRARKELKIDGILASEILRVEGRAMEMELHECSKKGRVPNLRNSALDFSQYIQHLCFNVTAGWKRRTKARCTAGMDKDEWRSLFELESV